MTTPTFHKRPGSSSLGLMAILMLLANLLLTHQVIAQEATRPRTLRIFPASALAGQFRVGYVHGITDRLSVSGTIQYQMLHARKWIYRLGGDATTPIWPARVFTRGWGATLGPRLDISGPTPKVRTYMELLVSGKVFGEERMRQRMITYVHSYEGEWYDRIVKFEEWNWGAQVILGGTKQLGPFGIDAYAGLGLRRRYIRTTMLMSLTDTTSYAVIYAPDKVKEFCTMTQESIAKLQPTIHLGASITFDFAQPFGKSARDQD